MRTPASIGQLCPGIMRAGLLALLLAVPAAGAEETQLNGPVGVTLEQGAEGLEVHFVSRWLSPVELWDSERKNNRLFVLEEISSQRHLFLGEVPRGDMTLALYPLEDAKLHPARWQATLPAQSGTLVDLGLWDRFYELTFAGHAFAEESRAILSLRTGQELVAMSQPVATLFQDGEPPGQWLAGLHLGGTVRHVELFGATVAGDLLITLADPERQRDRVLVRLEDPGLAPLAGLGEVAFGFAAGAGGPPSLRLRLGQGEAAPRLVLQFSPSVGAVIPLGSNGLALSQAVTRGLRLERVGP